MDFVGALADVNEMRPVGNWGGNTVLSPGANAQITHINWFGFGLIYVALDLIVGPTSLVDAADIGNMGIVVNDGATIPLPVSDRPLSWGMYLEMDSVLDIKVKTIIAGTPGVTYSASIVMHPMRYRIF